MRWKGRVNVFAYVNDFDLLICFAIINPVFNSFNRFKIRLTKIWFGLKCQKKINDTLILKTIVLLPNNIFFTYISTQVKIGHLFRPPCPFIFGKLQLI